MSLARAEERAGAFFGLGRILLSRLRRKQSLVSRFSSMPIVQQLVAIYEPLSTSPYFNDKFDQVAFALLATDYPVQVPLSEADITRLATVALPRCPVLEQVTASALIKDKPRRKLAFPLKTHLAASVKVNIYAVHLFESFLRAGLSHVADYVVQRLYGQVTDDVLCNALLMAAGLARRLGPRAPAFAVSMVLHPKEAKALSVVLKAMGANSDRLGASLCEGDTLQGRGVGDTDHLADARLRCDLTRLRSDYTVDFPEATWRPVIRAVLENELGTSSLSFPELDQYWATRWAWCVNGSHSKVLEREGDDSVKIKDPAYTRLDKKYRRMFSEALANEPLTGWDGTTYVSVLEKQENGKTRTLYACDSRHYFAFNHLLTTVQKAWRNDRVVLDPGGYGDLGMAQKVLAMKAGAGINVMLDYAAFNEHHSNATQKMLFEELGDLTGYPPHLLAPLIASFDKEHLFYKGNCVGRKKGTLASGHRGTSFINSVLNAAYIRHALGEEVYSRLRSLHVGDDVYIAAPTYELAGQILDSCKTSGLRMHAEKQSVGAVGAEFLRTAIRDQYAVGYLARSVSGIVSGNWTNDTVLAPQEFAQSLITSCRSLINRSQSDIYATLLARSLHVRTRLKVKTCHALLIGSLALGEGPVFHSDGTLSSADVLPAPPAELSEQLDKGWPTHATDTYLEKSLAPVERLAQAEIGRTARSAMLVASYSKALSGSVCNASGLRLGPVKRRVPYGASSALALLRERPKDGCLTRYPILQLLKGSLTPRILRLLVDQVAGDSGARDIVAEAWGAHSSGKLIDGVLSYSDAAAFCKRTTADVIYNIYPVFK